MKFETEPAIKVGLIEGAREVRITLAGDFLASTGEALGSGDYLATLTEGGVSLKGEAEIESASLTLAPTDFENDRVTIHDITIGINFHWQRKEAQVFQGSLTLMSRPSGLVVINELPVESYLVSVISSEMSASCPPDLLRAHAVVSRSWLLAQLENKTSHEWVISTQGGAGEPGGPIVEVVKWYDRENHSDFDVCADDHCQRYQGISRAFSNEAFDSVRATRGAVLTWDGRICDTRYSKSCGGMTQSFGAAWEDKDVPYLSAVYDGKNETANIKGALTDESGAAEWITGSPEAFCNTRDQELLARILPGFDQETLDFFRWSVWYTQIELTNLVESRTGLGLGRILDLIPLERGESGRIVRLKIVGAGRIAIIGKELEIRRALSRSHLYSSAFVVQKQSGGEEDGSQRFRLLGAGWGHGVGLCQIGAAVMASEGYSHEEILGHYFRRAELERIY